MIVRTNLAHLAHSKDMAAALQQKLKGIRPGNERVYLAADTIHLARTVVRLRLKNASLCLQDGKRLDAAIQLSLAAHCLETSISRPVRANLVVLDRQRLGLLRQAIGYHLRAIGLLRLVVEQRNVAGAEEKLAHERSYLAKAYEFLYHQEPSYCNGRTRKKILRLRGQAAPVFSRLGRHEEAFYERAHITNLRVDRALACHNFMPVATSARAALAEAALCRSKPSDEIREHRINLELVVNLVELFGEAD